MKKRSLVAPLLVATIATVVFASRASDKPEATVVYYYIPGCTICQKTTERLQHELAPYHDRVPLRLVESRSEEGRAAAKEHGFLSHGLVLFDGKGHAEMVESDHRVYPEHVTEALGRILPATIAAAN